MNFRKGGVYAAILMTLVLIATGCGLNGAEPTQVVQPAVTAEASPTTSLQPIATPSATEPQPVVPESPKEVAQSEPTKMFFPALNLGAFLLSCASPLVIC